MTDHGIELAIGDDYGPKVRIPLGKLNAVYDYLIRGYGVEHLPVAATAEKVASVLTRANEVRHFVFTLWESIALAWAIDTMGGAGYPIGGELERLRGVLPNPPPSPLDDPFAEYDLCFATPRHAVRVPVPDVRLLRSFLVLAPGGERESPSAMRAASLLDAALERGDEVRYHRFDDRQEAEILLAIERMMSGGVPVSEALLQLRDELGAEEPSPVRGR